MDVVEIARELGLAVWESESLPAGVSGKLAPSEEHGGESGYAIFVNRSEPLQRKRFTVAHEIGHFLLHRDKIGSGIEDDEFYRSRLSNAVEAEANRVAADLLMPFELINRLTDEDETRDIDRLASRLGVSIQALKIRLGIPVTD